MSIIFAHRRTQFAIFSYGILLLCFPPLAGAVSPTELAKTPATFDQQPVKVIGEVSNVVTRYGEKPYTTFELLDEGEVALPVFIWGEPKFKQGEMCRVTGTFVLEKMLAGYSLTHGIEAEKVNVLSEAELPPETRIFRKKTQYGVRGTRGFYLPQ